MHGRTRHIISPVGPVFRSGETISWGGGGGGGDQKFRDSMRLYIYCGSYTNV